MFFNASEVQPFISGSVNAETTPRGCRYLRFTPSQMADYCDPASFTPPEKKFVPKSRASSGLRLELSTDAAELIFACDVDSGSSRVFYDFDLRVDGILTDHFSVEDFHRNPSPELHFRLDGKRHEVRLFFPQLASVTVRSLELKGATVAEPLHQNGFLIAYGDSITQGYDARHPSLCYANALADRWNLQLINKAVGGDIFRPTLLKEPDPVTPSFITVAYGANDWYLPKADFERNVPDFFTRLRALYPAAPTAVILPIWNGFTQETTAVGTFQEMRQYIRTTAEKFAHVRIVDGWSLTPHLPEFYSPDLLHPTDAGFLSYAHGVLNQLADLLP